MVAFLCITVIGGAAIITSFLITSQIKSEYQTLLNTAYNEMKLNQKNVYIAVKDISPGEIIQMKMLEKKTVYSSQPLDTYMTVNEIGKAALVNIKAGTQILNSMITDHNISPKLREMEYQVININSNIKKHDTVDIRIFYPNGESYVVLAKKEIKTYVPEATSIYLWLEEDELLRMSAAIVDAGLYTGSKLYVTKYIEPTIQEASIITYTPSLSILSLIEHDPNIIKRCSQKLNKDIRKALENRLADNLDQDVSAASYKVDTYNSFVTEGSADNDYDNTNFDRNSTEIEKQDTNNEDSNNEYNNEYNNGNYIENNNKKNDGNIKNKNKIIAPTPTNLPGNNKSEKYNDESELGSESYFYYADKAKG